MFLVNPINMNILDIYRLCMNFYLIFEILICNCHSRPENLKKSRPKNSRNQINQFHEIFFWPNSIFCNFKISQKSIFELGKSLKQPKMQFHEKIFFDQNPFFYHFKNGQKSIFELGKSLKLNIFQEN